MATVFVSYSRRDTKFVDAFVENLENAGHQVWIDREGIEGGDQWRRQIVEAIEGADAFILMVSSNSLQSDNVRKEVDVAESATVRVFPVDIETPNIEMPTQVKYQLAGLQRIDLVTDFEKGYRQLQEWLGGAEGAAQQRIVKPPPLQKEAQPSTIPKAAIAAGAVLALIVCAVVAYLAFTRPTQPLELTITSTHLMLQLQHPDSMGLADPEFEILKEQALDTKLVQAQGFDSFSMLADATGGGEFLDYQIKPIRTDKSDIDLTAPAGQLSLVSLLYEGSPQLEISTGSPATLLRFSNSIGDTVAVPWRAFAEISLPDSFLLKSFTCQLVFADNGEVAQDQLQDKAFRSSFIEPAIYLANAGDQFSISIENPAGQERTILTNLPVLDFQPLRFERQSREYLSTLEQGFFKFVALDDTTSREISGGHLFEFQAQALVLNELKVVDGRLEAKLTGTFSTFKTCQGGHCTERLPSLLAILF